MRTAVLALAAAAACDAFAPAPMPALRSRAAPSACRLEMQAGAPKNGGPAARLATGFLGVLATASLLLSPALDVLQHPSSTAPGAAHAQGATSKKSTRGAPSKDANKDPESILRLSLPINEKNPIREAQAALEMNMDKALKETKNEKWGKVAGLTRKAANVMANKEKDILKDVPADRQDAAKALITEVKTGLADLGQVIETQKKEAVENKKREVLAKIGDIEQLMVSAFPYEVPAEFASLPQLKGRAEADIVLKKADGSKFDVDGTIYDKLTLKMVFDGYSAPVTTGNLIDLINKGFYNGMAIQRSDGFVVQTGDPNPDDDSAVHGYVENGKERTVPLEILADEDKVPTWGITLEDDGRPLSQPKLPFSVYGALAMARVEDNPDSGSSQWFFLLFDPELVTAGRNLMDGRYSTFGYVIEGNRGLSNVYPGDIIESVKVTKGLENLVLPKK